MVKRLLLITLIALLLLIGGAAVGIWWLLNTEAGACWLLTEASRVSSVKVEVEVIEGRLRDRLQLKGVRVIWPQGEARLDSIQLQWRPRRLLAGHLEIEELSVAGGVVAWSAPPAEDTEKGPPFAWPQIEGWPLQMRVSVHSLMIDTIELRPPEGEIRKLERLVARLEWHDGLFIVSGLETAGEGYRLEGSGEAGFDKPRLRLDLRLRLPSAARGMDGLSLRADLSAVDGDAFAGPFEVRGLEGSKLRLHLKAEVEGKEEKLRLRRFELTRPGLPGTLSGEGEVRLGGEAPRWNLKATVADLDLGPETGVKTDLAGTVEATGKGPEYRGSFELANRTPGWRTVHLSGPFAGSAQGVDFPKLEGSWLRGRLAGDLHLAWSEGFALAGSLEGRRLDPSVFTPQWPGRINLDLSGDLARPASGPMTAHLRGRLLESTLRGRALTGAVEADVAGKDLRLAVFELHGDGFDFSAKGRLAERIDYRAEIARLSGLLPGAEGAFTASGWVRWREGKLAGALDAQGRQLAYSEYSIGALKISAHLPAGNLATVAIDGSRLAYGRWRLQTANLNLSGSLPRHEIDFRARWSQGELRMSAAGGWRAKAWKGRLHRLEGRDADAGPWRLTDPAGLEIAAERFRVSSLRLAGSGSEWLEIEGEAVRGPWRGSGEARWEDLDLSRANHWLTGMILDGRSSGGVRGRFRQDGSLDLSGKVTAAGRLKRKEVELSVQNAEATIDWHAQGLKGTLAIELKEGGRLSGRVTSNQPGRLAFPERGSIEADWTDLDLARLRPWTPQGLDLAGRIEGSATGDWLPGLKLAISGETGVKGGRLSWKTEEGILQADLRTAHLDWDWRGAALAGELALELTEYGKAKGNFRLPITAQLPPVFNPDGPLRLDLSANAREKGLLGVFFPGVVRESRGELELRLQANGTWNKPDLSGHARLAKAGAFFPPAGIELKEVSLDVSLAGDEVKIESFSARSGPGRLTGNGTVRLKNWRPDSYKADLKGSRFEVVNLPELQLTVTPDLSLNGTPKRLEVRGEVRVPEMLVRGREREVIRESPDVVMVGAEAETERPLPLGLDIRIHIILGDHVLVKTAGVDARLEGELDLQVSGPDRITGRGEIKVAQGTYSTYGVKLKIVRGRMLYSGGPINQPTLDILALRTVGEVKAGVQVGGTPRSPIVKLYSEPAMPDTDILSYIVLGRPMGEETGQAGVLTSAAAALLSQGESAALQDRIKRKLGVDVLEVESGGGDVTASMVTVGKYLSPRLYLSFGRSLFTGATETRLRYTISKKWELESKAAPQATGVDLFYKIEFK